MENLFSTREISKALDDRTRYFVNPEKDVCLYKMPCCPDGECVEFYTNKTKRHERQFYFGFTSSSTLGGPIGYLSPYVETVNKPVNVMQKPVK
jgi:hypothetical protein